MEGIYSQKDQRYSTAIRDLKALLFDMVCLNGSNWLAMQSKINQEFNEKEKARRQEISQEYSEVLNQMMGSVNQLVAQVEALEKFQRQMASLDKDRVETLISNIDHKKIEKAFQDEMLEKQKQENNMLHQIQNHPSFPADFGNMEVIKQGPPTVMEKEIEKEEIPAPTIQFIDTTPEIEEVEEVIEPVADIGLAESEKEIVDREEISPVIPEETSFIPTEVIQEDKIIVPEKKEEPILPISEEVSSDVTSELEEEISPSVPALDSINHQVELVEDMQENLKQGPKTKATMTFLKVTKQVTKAIIVTQGQYQKLEDSKNKQQDILEAKDVLDVTFPKTNLALDKGLEKEQNLENKLVATGILEPDSVTQQQKIESMLEEASDLYKQGKLDEAQNLYSQISVMNKEGKSSTKGFPLTKK